MFRNCFIIVTCKMDRYYLMSAPSFFASRDVAILAYTLSFFRIVFLIIKLPCASARVPK